ncbi:MAG: hypothetical protein A2600_02030 [Candidatus Lambdaproteobacteria bacterium RIFOXYD1_FULL_56_27]|uniref:Uncharacterized protein n=1 Tax=Candidatus Lambdaproteobacteria bacterium RIFOXYD2_FULL_56_26 TaxID=1817773 RepID=A0A1F6GMQ8_9PROT|nr:MAG: hypothetical protein A2557_12400 [Candidatus Lambdaproteobacteria bacterium RIFOXYD2_FULL_56_26]OGH05618.1 MAG: hypothetical protein A2426_04820 [Candidatus Lambdaproteobacteria bacterium RIFOXYC1_FULL_56_13]OGH08578.1 MAG: hypothetical protein A2600_02030 [Candidatus Lambdaproteobacteria bacterium RIFOXYD1_FULL_56_27]
MERATPGRFRLDGKLARVCKNRLQKGAESVESPKSFASWLGENCSLARPVVLPFPVQNPVRWRSKVLASQNSRQKKSPLEESSGLLLPYQRLN